MATPVGGDLPTPSESMIEGLLEGGEWEFGTAAHTLTYSFNLSGVAGSGSWTAAQEQAVRSAFAAWSAVANIQFVQVTSGKYFYQSTADIAISLTGKVLQTKEDAVGMGMFPDPSQTDSSYYSELSQDFNETLNSGNYANPAGDIFFDSQKGPDVQFNNFAFLNPGGYTLELMLHEIGHALGLKHPQDDLGPGQPSFEELGIGNLDNDYNTVMSYTAESQYIDVGNPSTPMPVDILAMQYLYGVNTTTHVGNNTYYFRDNGNAYTIWDAGGVDTVDASTLSAGVELNLQPGQISTYHDPRDSNYVSAVAMAYVPTETQYGPVTLPASDFLVENAIGSAGSDGIIGNDANNTLLGGAGNDQLIGNAGDDYLNGGAGADIMTGGDGNDTYVVDNLGDQIFEFGNAGVDQVLSSISIDLSSLYAIENATLTGSAALNLRGNSLSNVLTGNAGANILDGGGGGTDTIDGGAGNDTVTYADFYDFTLTVDLSQGTALGTNVAISSETETDVLRNIENVIGVTGNDNHLVGDAVANRLTGGAADDYLDGGAGADILTGGLGDDTYIVDNVGDKVVEAAGGGTDLIKSSISFSLAALPNVENLTLTGTAAINGTGNAQVNVITGNDGNNTLDGGAGADTLTGGLGNDTYIIDNAGDTVTEDVGGGTDLIKSSVSIDLSAGAFAGQEIENVTLTGTAAINATGNDLGNMLTGNAGANILEGGLGDDVLDGGAGTDTVSYADHADGLEINLATGKATDGSETDTLKNIENVTGSAGDDVITGNAGANLLDGGAGADQMVGGAGNDTYIVDDAGDTVTEGVNGGTDLVKSSVSFVLGANIENLTLANAVDPSGADTSLNNIDGTGNAQANVITGNSGNNILDGGAGADTLTGGLGDDTYIVDNVGDKVIEAAGGGTDTIEIVAGYSTKAFAYTLATNLENLDLSAQTVAVTATGNAANNVITGGSGNDVLNGGAGADTLTGGLGNDIYVIDNAGDKVVEATGGGTDTIQSSVSIDLSTGAFAGQEIENVTLTGAAALNATGNSLNNILTGTAAANTLAGGAGDDTLSGGSGNDTLDGGAGSDTLDGGAGIDTVSYDDATSDVTIDLSKGLETNPTVIGFDSNTGSLIIGTATDTLKNIENVIGSFLNDTITGDSGANILDGGGGTNTIDGGAGIDTVSYASQAGYSGMGVTVNLADGTGSIYTIETDTLINIENVTGTDVADTISGDGHANVLTGAAGNDTLDGAAGADTLIGGLGDDTFIIDNVGDKVVENAGEGTDTVKIAAGYSTKAFAYTLAANLENLDLSAQTVGVTATGNAASNVITGGRGNDVLNGAAGADTLIGGLGNDTYIIDNVGDAVTEDVGGGIDTIKSSVSIDLSAGAFAGQEIENVTLTGTAAINVTGNDLGNMLTGNAGANILEGGLGDDVLDGGAGTDTVSYADHADGLEINLATGKATDGSETDTLKNIENVTGSAGDDVITGNAGANLLDGGAGADQMVGGAGNDTYIVDDAGDTVTEGVNGGTDLVKSSVSFVLGTNVENLTLTGTAAIDGTGNTQANAITGNSGNNILDGGAGADTLIGGLGDDTYIVDNVGDKVVEAAGGGTDLIKSSISFSLAALPNVEDLTLTGTAAINGTGNAQVNVITGNDGNNTLDGGAGADTLTGGLGNDTYIIDNAGDTVTEDVGGGTDLIKSSVSIDLSAGAFAGQEIENVTLTGMVAINATGNDLNNVLTGNAGANILEGGLGDDVLDGGAGTDTVSYADHADGLEINLATGKATDGSETDTLKNIENVTGSAGDDVITGNAGANLLDGGAGSDQMAGGAGNDTYIVDDAGDTVTEGVNGGTDLVKSSVSFVLGANVENLTLTGTAAIDGTGNTVANAITGNSGDNILDGGAGADILTGGLGDDTYIVDNVGDKVTEGVNAGTDTIEIVAGYSTKAFAYTLAANLENLDLSTQTVGVTATGNTANNLITGGSGNDVLNGGAGADTLVGGLGNDTYVLDNAGDKVVEAAGGGTDKIQSSVSLDLSAGAFAGQEIENVTLTGTAAINVTGNDLDNVLTGNAGANMLTGGDGDDTLIGGAGNDILSGGKGDDILNGGGGNNLYMFDLSGFGTDTIIGFNRNADALAFTGLTGAGGGEADLNDLIAAISSVTDAGAGHDVTVGFNDGSDIIFKNSGTGSISSITQLVANSSHQITV